MKAIALKNVAPKEEVPVYRLGNTWAEMNTIQILVSYIDTTLPRELRRNALQETYNFNCDCSLCSVDSEQKIDPRESVQCPSRCGGICKIPSEGEDHTPPMMLCAVVFTFDYSRSSRFCRMHAVRE
jgi:SET and MYND domain-containing protein